VPPTPSAFVAGGRHEVELKHAARPSRHRDDRAAFTQEYQPANPP
jgi:hypothetical protein